MTDYQKLFADFVNEACDIAGQVTLNYFRKEIPIDDKQDKSPVTQADREIEQRLRDLIGKTFPNHGIIGEEFGVTNDKAEFVWIIDPIDGTRAFMTGKPLFGTIIGLMHNGKPTVGAINQAYTKERWFGIADQLATHNNQPIKVASPRKLEASRLYTGSPDMFRGEDFENYLSLCRSAKWPQYGCDCYAYGLLAMGWTDLVVEKRLKIYDVAGVIPIITGAGGFTGDWDLNPVTVDFNGCFVASSTKELAAEAVKLFAPAALKQ
jgi:inositol-phosphate phosphatase/L-galactose 1-phosphate phosphatase/histidinol-phosphatase